MMEEVSIEDRLYTFDEVVRIAEASYKQGYKKASVDAKIVVNDQLMRLKKDLTIDVHSYFSK